MPYTQGQMPGKTEIYTQPCCNNREKPKLKSGKYVKTNINIQSQEQWPHLNVMKKYCKRTTFENMEFEAFVAGEARIIEQCRNRIEKEGRIQLLCKIAHWVCRTKDWNCVKSLYEAILESIEMGEENWVSDFSHYENMLLMTGSGNNTVNTIQTERRKEKMEVYWCKPYQRNACNERSPHLMSIRNDEPPVPVIHVCAACLQRENKRLEHPESECPKK